MLPVEDHAKEDAREWVENDDAWLGYCEGAYEKCRLLGREAGQTNNDEGVERPIEECTTKAVDGD
jgi:hypothetical protein